MLLVLHGLLAPSGGASITGSAETGQGQQTVVVSVSNVERVNAVDRTRRVQLAVREENKRIQAQNAAVLTLITMAVTEGILE